MDLVGKTLGDKRYRIDSWLGEGGMGSVYLAYDIKLQREVAIKVVQPNLTRQSTNRFMEEARIMAKLDHPGIVRVYDMAEDGEKHLYYLSMEFIKGGNLRQRLAKLSRQHKWLPLTEAMLLVQQLCQTVEYAHQHGVLHRDIKPDNLMIKLEPAGGLPFRIVLTDLGLAKYTEGLHITQEGSALGTPAYMSPEQALGQPTDKRSDVYSLGILLYELAVGSLPFRIQSARDAIRFHTQESSPPAPRSIRPDLPEELEQVILKALEKDPKQRYSSARELGDALAAVTIHNISEIAAVSTEIVDSDGEHETSLITEYEQSIVADVGQADASLKTVSDTGSISQRGLSVFGDQSISSGDRPLIQIVNKDKSVRVMSLTTDTTTIGRAKDNLIVLDDEKASHHHAEIRWNGVECHVTDLNSSNGTFLEKEKILSGIAETWHANQSLRIGDTWLRFIGPTLATDRALRAESILSSAGAGVVGVEVDPQHLQVQAGGTVSVRVTLLNQSDLVDHFSLSLTGIPPDWISSLPPSVYLMNVEQDGRQKETAFTLQVPRSPESLAGQHEMMLRVTSKNDPSQFVDVPLVLTVEPYSQFEGSLQPQRLRAGQTGTLTIFNQGNSLEKFTIQFQDPANELTFQLSQPDVEVPAGKSAEKKFQANLREMRWIGGSKTHPFSATIGLQKGERQTRHGEMLSWGRVPPWLLLVLPVCCLFTYLAYAFVVAPYVFPPPTLIPTATPTLTLTATLTPSATSTQAAPVIEKWCVYLNNQPPISLTNCPSQVVAQTGQSLTIQWQVKNADKVFISGLGDQKFSGSTPLSVTEDMTLITLKASNRAETIEKSVQIVRPTSTAVPPTAVPTATYTPTATPTPTDTPTNPPLPPPPPALDRFTPAKIHVCPDQTGFGDRDFNGNGPDVVASAELITNDERTQLWVKIHLDAKETRDDWTEAEKWDSTLLWSAPIGSTIIDYSPHGQSTAGYRDTNHDLDTPPVSGSGLGSGLVRRFEIIGDTDGNDVGNCTLDDVYVDVYFNPIQVKYSTP